MKTTRLIAAVLGLGLFGSALAARAQVFPVSFQLTIQQQDYSSQKNGVWTDRVKSIRVGSTDILTLLAGAYQTNLPVGSKLVLVDYDHFQVRAANDAVLLGDVSDYLTYADTYSATNYLYQGRENSITGGQNYTYFYRATIEFNDPSTGGNSFTFAGNVLEKYSKSAENTFGHRTYQGSLALTGTGSGRKGEDFYLLSGRITTPTVKWTEAD